ncbi:MAG TPA: glycosyltransferase family 2 protein [Blastocatellia bacterium]|nr:glycosyltransferase family 2 protein [Blastocatellia bacterium]
MVDSFLLLAAILILQGLLSLAEGVAFHAFVRRSISADVGGAAPRASVIAPCKGLEPGFEASLAALFDQHYPDYEIIFALASEDDPAKAAIARMMQSRPDRTSKLVIAAPSDKRSEKINNLLAAIEQADPSSKVLVFVDSDALADRDWLRDLVGPLADSTVGASTGYRWYLPPGGTRGAGDTKTRGTGRRVSASPPLRVAFWSHLLSAWNGSVATTLGDHGRNFAWGGSTAIRRETFDRIGVAVRWENAVSDDYVLTRAVQDAGLRIRFVPRCLMVTRESSKLKSLLEFTTRQVIITRVYRPAAWWIGLISHGLFALGFFGGLGMLLIRLGVGSWRHGALGLNAEIFAGRIMTLAAALIVIYLLGSLKGALRLRAASIALPQFAEEIRASWATFCVLWPALSLLFLYNFIRSWTTRRITWRGITYELVSDTETRVLTDE